VTEPGAPKQRRGCLFYGCLSGIACLLIILIAFLVGLYQLKKMINFYTDASQVTLPAVHLSTAEMDDLKQRIENFQDAVRSGRPTPPLTLNADEINAFIQTDTNMVRLKGKLYVTLEGNRLKGQVSVPLDELGLRIFKGRYLNGSGIFAVGLQKGMLVVNADSLSVKGKPLPGVYMDKIRSQNLADGINNNPKASVGLNHLQEVQISDGKMVIVPKPEK
jgi:hypothetical protein